ncbi:MAG: VOC family protein [Oscillospiraceae bacterium]|nr:VOC family protein [Oscillospiraceae bacterium]
MFLATIHFPGNCDEAISFYKEVLEAEVRDIAYFKDAPKDSGMESLSLSPNFVMHSLISIHGSLVSMTDGVETKPTGDNFTFLITEDTVDEVTALYNKLLEGGKEVEALAPVFWASMYGVVEDKFGVNWQVMTSDGL